MSRDKRKDKPFEVWLLGEEPRFVARFASRFRAIVEADWYVARGYRATIKEMAS